MADMTIRQAAEALGVSVDTVRRWLRSGRLQGTRENTGNRGGQGGWTWVVDVPASMLANQQPADDDEHHDDAMALVVVERDQLRQQLDDLRAERDWLRGIVANLTVGIGPAIASGQPAPVQLPPDQGINPSGSRVGRAWAALRGRG